MSLYQSLILPAVVHGILHGEARKWTRADWIAALIKTPIRDAKRIAVHVLLDHAGGLSRTLWSEIGFRQSLAKARASGADVWCCFHDRDLTDCPEGEHE